MTKESEMTEEYDALITAAQKCATACQRCAAACLHEQDIAKMANCIGFDEDCAELCELVASFTARGSRFTSLLASVLADACKICGEECSHHDLAYCRVCAGACRACESACRALTAPQSPG
ncbi:MAG TPA: four-helix bundle copper-binding protein [Polyangiaceae bacterium]|jgi:hypothetical protein|nr:four-helix bundle copper-binding protein [Polyangiaceae bacterium]